MAKDTATKDSKSKKSKDEAKLYCDDAEVWRNRFDLARRHQEPIFKKWAEWYENLYAIKNYKNIGIWRSKMFIPVMSYKAWTYVAKILAMRPGFSVKMYNKLYSDEDRKRIEKANLKLEYDYDNPMLDETIRDRLFDTLTDTVVCGIGFGNNTWRSGERKIFEHIKKDDGTIDYENDEEETITFEHNDLDPIDPMDVYGSPGKRAWEKKPWIIRQFRSSRAELLSSDLYDEAEIKALKVLENDTDPMAKYKNSRNKFLTESGGGNDPETMDDTVDSFYGYECQEKTKDGVYIITFIQAASDKKDHANKKRKGNWVKVREDKQPYWHGKYTIVPSYLKRKPHSCWGESIFEVTESMANGMNDILNQVLDASNIVLSGGVLKRETGTTIYDFYYAPGGEIRYSGPEPKFELPPSPDMNLFSGLMGILESNIDKATVSPYAAGTQADPNDKTQGTAEGITRLQEASGEIISFLKSNFMQFMKQNGQRWTINNRQFLEEPVMVEKQVDGKTKRMEVTAGDFTKDMLCVIDEDSMQPATKAERLDSDLRYYEQLFAMQDRAFAQNKAATEAGEVNAPKPMYFNYERMARDLSNEMGKSNFDKLLHTEEADADEDDPLAGNSNLINAIRSAVDSGEMEVEEAQYIIDEIEGRIANGQPINNLNELATAAATAKATDDAAAGAGAPAVAGATPPLPPAA
jgi:hypothetical protein